MSDFDPRWEWVEIITWGGPQQWIKGECNHLTPQPVHAEPTGELVAHLCPDCDQQLPAEWRRSDHIQFTHWAPRETR